MKFFKFEDISKNDYLRERMYFLFNLSKKLLQCKYLGERNGLLLVEFNILII